jgi:hypothetical protein
MMMKKAIVRDTQHLLVRLLPQHLLVRLLLQQGQEQERVVFFLRHLEVIE